MQKKQHFYSFHLKGTPTAWDNQKKLIQLSLFSKIKWRVKRETSSPPPSNFPVLFSTTIHHTPFTLGHSSTGEASETGRLKREMAGRFELGNW